jgi:hypothetical protein
MATTVLYSISRRPCEDIGITLDAKGYWDTWDRCEFQNITKDATGYWTPPNVKRSPKESVRTPSASGAG